MAGSANKPELLALAVMYVNLCLLRKDHIAPRVIRPLDTNPAIHQGYDEAKLIGVGPVGIPFTKSPFNIYRRKNSLG